jgi:hypothetical protein
VSRWLVLPLGLALAGVAAYAVLSGSLLQGPETARRSGPQASATAPGHAEIGDRSREQLREILREADAREARRRSQ